MRGFGKAGNGALPVVSPVVTSATLRHGWRAVGRSGTAATEVAKEPRSRTRGRRPGGGVRCPAYADRPWACGTSCTRCTSAGSVGSCPCADVQRPRHVALMLDGNRRWAREEGFRDVNTGHRVGAAKIADLLAWCDEAGVEVVTLFLLSTDNLTPPGGRAGAAAGDHRRRRRRAGRAGRTVAAARRGRARPAAGDVGPAAVRRGRPHPEPVGHAAQRRGRLRRPAGDRGRGAQAAARSTPRPARRSRSSPRSSTSTTSRRISTHPASPIPTWSSAPRASSVSRVSCCGSPRTRSSGSARRTGPSSGKSTSCGRCATTPPGTADFGDPHP